ncbi:protein of unknown function [Acidithiobacillus ferrivorans]|uniref:Uncharacterized protein n=1 Tax=Acidithiobacillus ferrivorans TaxID=160808 RepID=A0A060UNF2_9PROT|nr:hypothetical protein AFERRI_370069 [Acidithiobacillus ferrivorans]SMH65706.1 protein of unknown function [Acidithiobacillus ferrivorans]
MSPNDRNQSAADHHGSTATGQRLQSFPSNLRTHNMDQEADVRLRQHLPEYGGLTFY